jgi:outer membrane protein OmpA-like peptidoglycan-associated protein
MKTNTAIKRTMGIAVGVVVLSLAALGCGPTTNTALERARMSYNQAQQNPQIATHAPVALQEAQQSLQRAERAWSNDEGSKEVSHLAYVTEQQVAIARATAEKKLAEADIERHSAEREKVLLEARTRDATRAEREAVEARTLAEQEAARARQLEQELATLKAKETERGLVLTLGDVLFEYNRAELKPGAMQNLYQLVTFLKENPNRNILIEGHADSTGSTEYNRDLSQRRAQAVESFLVHNGVSASRIISRGYGEAYPVASNTNEAGRQENRRVEVVVLHEGELASERVR